MSIIMGRGTCRRGQVFASPKAVDGESDPLRVSPAAKSPLATHYFSTALERGLSALVTVDGESDPLRVRAEWHVRVNSQLVFLSTQCHHDALHNTRLPPRALARHAQPPGADSRVQLRESEVNDMSASCIESVSVCGHSLGRQVAREREKERAR